MSGLICEYCRRTQVYAATAVEVQDANGSAIIMHRGCAKALHKALQVALQPRPSYRGQIEARLM